MNNTMNLSKRSSKENIVNNNRITFIIPTIGRDSLLYSINSLLNQTIENWYAIIIFDGIKKNINISDDRIKIIEIDKLGKNINSAGEVRNYGMSLVETEWIGFLDDDDIIADDYLECFYKELMLVNNNDLSVVIFRMKMGDRIIPKLDADNFYICDVGISFIIKKDIYDNNIKFIPDGAEDYLYLDLIRKNNYKMVISPYIKYYVREDDCTDIEEKILGNRIYINKKNISSKLLLNGYLKIIYNLE